MRALLPSAFRTSFVEVHVVTHRGDSALLSSNVFVTSNRFFVLAMAPWHKLSFGVLPSQIAAPSNSASVGIAAPCTTETSQASFEPTGGNLSFETSKHQTATKCLAEVFVCSASLPQICVFVDFASKKQHVWDKCGSSLKQTAHNRVPSMLLVPTVVLGCTRSD